MVVDVRGGGGLTEGGRGGGGLCRRLLVCETTAAVGMAGSGREAEGCRC